MWLDTIKPVRAFISVADGVPIVSHNPVRGCMTNTIMFWQPVGYESPTGIMCCKMASLFYRYESPTGMIVCSVFFLKRRGV